MAKERTRDESPDTKAMPIRAIYFDKAMKWPGLPGAAMCLRVGRPLAYDSQTAVFCESIFLYNGEFVINATTFMPKTCSSILCYEFA